MNSLSWDIRISVDQSYPFKLVASFNDGLVVCVADELSVVILDNWRADLVCSGLVMDPC